MELTTQNPTAATLEVNMTITPEDYTSQVNEEVKRTRKLLQLPGFRRGQVPRSLIEKKYGKGFRADIISSRAFDELQSYLKEHNINTLGHPIASNNLTDETLSKPDSTYTFTFTVGLEPQIDIDLNNLPLPSWKEAVITEEEITETLQQELEKRPIPVEVDHATHERAIVYGKINEQPNEAQPQEDLIKDLAASLFVSEIEIEETQEKLKKASVGDKVILNLYQDLGQKDTKLRTLLHIEEQEVERYKESIFELTIERITEPQNIPFTAEGYKQFFGPNETGETEEDFRNGIKKYLEHQYNALSFNLFKEEMGQMFASQFDNIELPEENLAFTFKQNQKEEDYSIEKARQEVIQARPQIIKQLVTDALAKRYNIEVTDEELKDTYRAEISSYFGGSVGSDQVQNIINSMVERFEITNEYRNRYVPAIKEHKVFTKLKEDLNLEITQKAAQEIEDELNNLYGSNEEYATYEEAEAAKQENSSTESTANEQE